MVTDNDHTVTIVDNAVLLSDGLSHSVSPMQGSSRVIGDTSALSHRSTTNHALFPAFPAAEMGHTLSVTLTVNKLQTLTNPQAFTSGKWQVTMQVPTAAPSALVTNVPTVTLHGISLQPMVVAVVVKEPSDNKDRSGVVIQLHIDGQRFTAPLCGV